MQIDELEEKIEMTDEAIRENQKQYNLASSKIEELNEELNSLIEQKLDLFWEKTALSLKLSNLIKEATTKKQPQ